MDKILTPEQLHDALLAVGDRDVKAFDAIEASHHALSEEVKRLRDALSVANESGFQYAIAVLENSPTLSELHETGFSLAIETLNDFLTTDSKQGEKK